MDEEFQVFLEYVEYKFLMKTIMGLEVQWKDKWQQKVDKFINKKMVAWEKAIALHLEHITWGWHPMYYIMTSVPLLQSGMPPIPWTHTNEEANIVVVAIRNMEKTIPAKPRPFSVLLLKMFLFVQGKGQAFANPIKGTKENILKWMQVGLSVVLSCVIKQMLQEEGYLLFAGAMIVFVSC